MDFSLNDEQQQMQETARDFFDDNEVIQLARRQMDGEDVVDDVWADLTEMDYPALTVPLDYDGLGDGMLYLALLLEEAGRHAMPGPFPETAAFAVPLIDEVGSESQKDRWLPRVADGDLTFSFALHADPGKQIPEAIGLDVERTDEGYVLDGSVSLVPYGGLVDRVVVAARTQQGRGYEGVSLFVVDPAEVDAERERGLDRTRPPFELSFEGHAVPEERLLGQQNGAGEALRRAVDRYTVATCAMLVGAADRAVDMSVEHGNEREQFGQPVGRFQGVKHRIADMWMDVQGGRSLTYYAAWTLANEESDAARAVSTAASFVTENCARIFGDDIQNHGGMGFTWDHDAHIYLKQAKAWESFLGTPRDHRERAADLRGI